MDPITTAWNAGVELGHRPGATEDGALDDAVARGWIPAWADAGPALRSAIVHEFAAGFASGLGWGA